MNRDEKIEQVARDLWDRSERNYWDSALDARPFDCHAEDEELADAARDWLATVTEVVDAILPQVTTVEEVQDLHHRAILVDESTSVWWASDLQAWPRTMKAALENGPLAVVWQP